MDDELARPTTPADPGAPIAPAPGAGVLPDGTRSTEAPPIGSRFGLWVAGFTRPLGPYTMQRDEGTHWHVRPASWDDAKSPAPADHTMRVPAMRRGASPGEWQTADEIAAGGGYFTAAPRLVRSDEAPATDHTRAEQGGP